MKKNNQKGKLTYEELSKTLTDEEMVDAYVLPSELSEEEKKERHAEFKKLRMEQLANMTDEEMLLGELMRMKVQLFDYVSDQVYAEKYSFGNQLKRYLKITGRSQSKFAEEINIHKTALSRIINDKEKPNTDIMYRLEKHSDKMIPANLWYKVHSIKLESEIKKNEIDRKLQYDKVKCTFRLGNTG